jgi:Transposase DDE domain
VVTVVDRGFTSAANLDYLRRAGGHFIAGERLRAGTAHVEEVLGRQGRYRQVRDNLRVKEVRLDSAPDLRWVLCSNPDEAARAAARREGALARIRSEVARIAAARTRLATTTPTIAAAAGRREAELAAHTRAECALHDHPALGRWLHPDTGGRLVLDTAKVRAEARLDGKYLLLTSDPHLSGEDVALGYTNLLEAERGFRDLKSTREPRPVYHRREPRIRAHVLLCWLALLLIRVAERRTGQSWPALARELGRLHAVTLTGPTGTLTQTTELSTAQQGILRACGLTPPPRITALHPA